MSEFTVRWPGHIQRYIDEAENGTLDEDALVFEWAYNHKIPEFTWMEVRADSHDGTTMLWRFQDHGGDDGHSMARCTGLVTLCCIEQWLDDPDMLPPGVHAPEELSAEILDSILVTMAEELIEVEGPIITRSLE